MGRRKVNCSEAGCALLQRQSGLCAKHFEAAGLVEKKCAHEGCVRPHCAKGLCDIHYKRQRRGQDADRPFRGTVGYVRHGYKYLGGVLAHRTIMAASLGRDLIAGETVHHKNGDRLDNRLVRGHEMGGCPSTCCNLELWSKSQPAGQRVEDKTAWARSLLSVYEQNQIDAEAETFGESVRRAAA